MSEDAARKIAELSLPETTQFGDKKMDFFQMTNNMTNNLTQQNSLDVQFAEFRVGISELRRIAYENSKLLAIICNERNDQTEGQDYVMFWKN